MKQDAEIVSPITPPSRVDGGEVLRNEQIFSGPEKSNPMWVGVKYLFIFWTVRDIFRTFEFWTPKIPPWGGMGQICLGSNNSQINPHIRAKFGRDRKRGTDTHTEKGTLQLYIIVDYTKSFTTPMYD